MNFDWVEIVGRGGEFLEEELGEDGGFEDVGIVRTDAEADVDGAFELNRDWGVGWCEFGAGRARAHRELSAVTLKTNAVPGVDRGFRLESPHFGRLRAGNGAVLQRDQAVAMQSNIGVGRVWFQTLAHHDYRLAVFLSTSSDELSISGEAEIPADFLPDKVKRVFGAPHVGPAAGDAILRRGGVVGG